MERIRVGAFELFPSERILSSGGSLSSSARGHSTSCSCWWKTRAASSRKRRCWIGSGPGSSSMRTTFRRRLRASGACSARARSARCLASATAWTWRFRRAAPTRLRLLQRQPRFHGSRCHASAGRRDSGLSSGATTTCLKSRRPLKSHRSSSSLAVRASERPGLPRKSWRARSRSRRGRSPGFRWNRSHPSSTCHRRSRWHWDCRCLTGRMDLRRSSSRSTSSRFC